MEHKLHRDVDRKIIGGVCAGLADYFNIDVTLVRVIFIITLIMKGGGGLLYVILWIVLTPQTNINPLVEFSSMQAAPLLPAKKPVSTPRLIIGLVFILFGFYFLLDQFQLIPNFDIEKFWPAALIIIGLVLMVGFWKGNNVTEKPANNVNNTETSTDNAETL